MPEKDLLADAMHEANETFERMGHAVEAAVKKGVLQIELVEICKELRLEVDRKMLTDLKVDHVIHVHPWLPWYFWFPWRPLWCWWWSRYYPWYRCCPWWWFRCHWYPYPFI